MHPYPKMTPFSGSLKIIKLIGAVANTFIFFRKIIVQSIKP